MKETLNFANYPPKQPTDGYQMLKKLYSICFSLLYWNNFCRETEKNNENIPSYFGSIDKVMWCVLWFAHVNPEFKIFNSV